MIALVKFVHLAALICWCAGLLALPIVLGAYRRHCQSNRRYAEFRLITHYGYIGFATPAAIIAIAAGTGLIFAADVTADWLLIKLILVSFMALVHAWFGHLIIKSGEGRGQYAVPTMFPPGIAAVVLMGLVLWLALVKPDVNALLGYLPEMLLSPRGNALPGGMS